MIKVTKTPTKVKKDITYPCLGIYNTTGIIVLFTDETTGTAMTESEDYIGRPIGTFITGWYNNWIPYTGTITLTNEL